MNGFGNDVQFGGGSKTQLIAWQASPGFFCGKQFGIFLVTWTSRWHLGIDHSFQIIRKK